MCYRVSTQHLHCSKLVAASVDAVTAFFFFLVNDKERLDYFDYGTPRLAAIAGVLCGPMWGPLCAGISLTLKLGACNMVPPQSRTSRSVACTLELLAL